MGVCPRLEYDNITLINCLWVDFHIYGAFEFLCNSIMTSCMISLPHLRVPCNKKNSGTINGFVYIRIVDAHSFLCHGTPIFNCIICIQSNFEL